MSKTVAFTSYN